jgi:hypothetical protein
VRRAVSLNVMLGGMFGVIGSMHMMAMSQVGMVSGRFMVAVVVVTCGFAVMARSVFVVFRCLGVMMRCFS